MTVHLRNPHYPETEMNMAACNDPAGRHTSSPGEVTCFVCRKTNVFLNLQRGVGGPTPTEEIPTLLRGVIAQCESLLELHERAQLTTTTHESEH